jgi:hypothetical protein
MATLEKEKRIRREDKKRRAFFNQRYRSKFLLVKIKT